MNINSLFEVLIMGKLSNIDNAAAKKGSAINTLWQFIKFIVVSLGAFVIQTDRKSVV